MSMVHELRECCELFIQLMKRLHDEGKITKEIYEEHMKLKVGFLNETTKKISERK